MKSLVQVVFATVVMLTLVGRPVLASDQESHGLLYEYLAGDYLVVGQEMESDRPYSGKVVFSSAKDRLVVTRVIQGETVTGEGKIEHALGSDAADVLRVRFTRAGLTYEITYIWRSDLDNSARLSGYVYQPGKETDSPGLEALFRDQAKR